MSCEQTMQVLTVLGAWIGGIGSLTAAVTALWLARRGSRVRLRSSVGIRVMVGGGGPKEELLVIMTTNVGERPVVIENIGWRIGSRKKDRKYAIQTFSSRLTDQCPKKLEHGETASFRLFFSESSHWLRDFARDFVEPQSGRPASSLRAQIHTSIGHTEVVVPESNLVERLESTVSNE